MAADHESRERRRHLARAARSRLEASGGPTPDLREPRPGEIYGLAATAAMEVLWVVAEVENGRIEGAACRVRLVAADLFPGIGSRDVGVPALPEGPGVVGLRCGFTLWARPVDLLPARGIGRLEEEVHRRMLQKLATLGDAPSEDPPLASASEREVDEDPEYEDWIDEGPSRALKVLVALATERAPTTPAWQLDLEEPGVLPLLRQIHVLESRPHLGADRAPLPSLADGGWGLVIAREEAAGTRRALAPLLELRRKRLGPEKARVLEYLDGESWSRWLARHGVAAGRPSWDRVPAYLLLVGSHERIPREVERPLGLEYAVGRLDFEQPQDYRQYGEKIGGLEEEQAPGPGPEGFVAQAPGLDRARRLLLEAVGVGAVLVEGGATTEASSLALVEVAEALRAMEESLRSGQRAGLALRPVAETYAGLVLRIEELHRQRSWGKRIATEELDTLEAAAERLGRFRLFGDPATRPGSGA